MRRFERTHRILAGIFLAGALLLFLAPQGIKADSGIPAYPGGELLWENRGQTNAPLGSYISVATAGHMVFAAGNVGIAPYENAFDPRNQLDAFVCAMDAKTGATVWEDRLDSGYFDRFQQVAADDDRCYVGGWVRSKTTRFNVIIRAYDAKTGHLF